MGRVWVPSLHGSFIVALLVAVSGCPSAPSEEPARREPTETERDAPRGETGTVVGVVRLVEGATLPRARLDASGSATNTPPACPPIEARDETPVFEVDGKLVNVLVSATGDRAKFFEALPAREPSDVELIIAGDCRLVPRLVGAVEGDTLVLKNRAPIAMLPFIGQQGYVESLSSSESRRKVLEKRGVIRVGCGVSGYCGSTDVVVIPHPVFGVTGASGQFVIDNVPADQDVTLHAWHPLFEATNKTVRVGKGERVEVEMVIEPSASRARAAE
jgi:hypothetical protein